MNILKPKNRVNEEWPKCSFFGVYDGHGGSLCADFLRDKLHHYIVREPTFPSNPKEAIKNGFCNAEKRILESCLNGKGEIVNKSGSCAIICLIVGNLCYVANVGDSRAVLSGKSGKSIYSLSRDHKPNDSEERKRILEAGGQIYQTMSIAKGENIINEQQKIGPCRVVPGRLSVSRTFGDPEAKLVKYGGNPNVVISEPEIKSFKITPEHDFIVMASIC